MDSSNLVDDVQEGVFHRNWWALIFLLFGLSAYVWQFHSVLLTRTTWFTPINKTILITGCDTGIGQRLAKYFYDKGSVVFAGCLNLSSEGVKELREWCPDHDRLHVIQMDVTNEKQVDQAFEYVSDYVEKHGLKGLWSLINNAGVCVMGEFDWFTQDQCQHQVDVNLSGTIRVTKKFIPLIAKGKGRIINVSSVVATVAYPGLAVYCASKYAIEGFSDVLRVELARLGIKVIVVKLADFARLTHIMINHEKYKDEMWNNMDEDKRRLYGDYFKQYHDHILNNYGMTSPASFEKSSLLSSYEEAVFATDPSAYITSAPITLRITLYLLTCLPVYWKDKVLTKIITSMFKFDVNKLNDVMRDSGK